MVAAWRRPEFLLMSLICLTIIIVIIRTLVHTSFGRSLKAIRDSESAALASGKNITVIKTLSVVLSSALAAVAAVPKEETSWITDVARFPLESLYRG